jgi:hypothetical protein
MNRVTILLATAVSLLVVGLLDVQSQPAKEVAPDKPMLRFHAQDGGKEVLIDPDEVCERLVSPHGQTAEMWSCAPDRVEKLMKDRKLRWEQMALNKDAPASIKGCPGNACMMCGVRGGGRRWTPCLVNPRTCESICGACP